MRRRHPFLHGLVSTFLVGSSLWGVASMLGATTPAPTVVKVRSQATVGELAAIARTVGLDCWPNTVARLNRAEYVAVTPSAYPNGPVLLVPFADGVAASRRGEVWALATCGRVS